LRELAVRRNARRDDVHSAVHLVHEEELDHTHRVGECHPRYPLRAAAKWTTDSEADRQHHPRQRTAIAIEDDREARCHHADAEVTPTEGLRLPVAHEVREEALALPRGFVEHLVAPVA